jgi:hypothetical protein
MSDDIFGESDDRIDVESIMRQPGSTKNLAWYGNHYDLITAIGKAKAKFGKVKKAANGQVGRVTFKYSDLQHLLDQTESALLEEGVVVLQPLSTAENGLQRVSTVVAGHGGMIVCHSEFDPAWGSRTGDTGIKDLGLTQTYFARYQYRQIFGLVGEDADDHTHNPTITPPVTPKPKPSARAKANGSHPQKKLEKREVKEEQEKMAEAAVGQREATLAGKMTPGQNKELKRLSQDLMKMGVSVADIRQLSINISGATAQQVKEGDISYESAEEIKQHLQGMVRGE